LASARAADPELAGAPPVRWTGLRPSVLGRVDLPCALGRTDHPPKAAEEKGTDPLVITTWTQLRRHLRLWLASRFGAPLDAEVPSGLSGDVLQVPCGAGTAEEALVPGQTQGAAESVAALQAVLSKHPTLLADLAQWTSENIVGDPVVEHLSFARMTTTVRKTTRGGLFTTITRDPGLPPFLTDQV
jgi:hypothetical protein